MDRVLLACIVSTGLFLALHWTVARAVRKSFRRNLKLSRGIAAAVLVAVGVASAVRWWPLWREAFLVFHPSPADAWPVVIFVGHLTADLLWIVAGRVFLDSRVARDLVIHHLLGIAVCAVSFGLRAGYALIGAALVSEILPVLTSVGALARTWRLENLEHWVLRASLGAIAGFRMPVWLLLAASFVHAAAAPGTTPLQRLVTPIALCGLALVLTLDVYWVRSYLRLLRDFPRRGVADLSLDPLAPWFLEES